MVIAAGTPAPSWMRYSSRGRNSSSALNIQTLKAPHFRHLLLQRHHLLLISRRIHLITLGSPIHQKLIRIIRLKRLIQHPQAFAIFGDFLPIALDIFQVLREIRKTPLEDFAVQRRAHDGFEIDVFGPCLLGMGQDEIGGALDGAHKGFDLVWVLCEEFLVANVEDGAEAAAAQFGEFVDAEHLYIRLGTVLRAQPFLEFDHLDVLESDARVDFAFDDGFGHVHAAAHGRVVFGAHAIVGGEFVDLDLAEFSYVTDLLALERAEVGGDAAVLEVHDARKRLIEERSDGEDGELASFGGERVNHGFVAEIDFATSDDLRHVLYCCQVV